MNRQNIGGALDYTRLAQLNRPPDEETMRAAAVELRSRGLTDRDIGQALGLASSAVSKLLGEPGC
jgi:hypothetical protein